MLVAMMVLALSAVNPASESSAEKSRARPGTFKTHPATWATSLDNPPLAKKERREGTTEFLVRYGKNGKPTGCEIVSSSGHADLDEQTCRLVKARARFRPGKNHEGETVGGTYQNRVNWYLGKR